MSLFCRLSLAFLLFISEAFAYGAPRGLYVLQYPVDMPDVPLAAEDASLKDLKNEASDLTVLIFWSKSCFPCLREMKYLETLYPKAAQDNIRILLVSPASEWKDNAEERAFLTKFKAPTIPFYNDQDNQMSLKLGIGSTPYTVIMDKQGKKIATIQGEADWSSDKLYKMIKKLIK